MDHRKRAGSGSSIPRYETIDARDARTYTETAALAVSLASTHLSENAVKISSSARSRSTTQSSHGSGSRRFSQMETAELPPDDLDVGEDSDEDDLETDLFSFKARKLDEAFQSGDFKYVRQRSASLLSDPAVMKSPDRQMFLLNILSSGCLEQKLFSEAVPYLEMAKSIATSAGERQKALGFESSRIFAILSGGEGDQTKLELECKKLIKDMKKVFGKESHSYYSAIQLMASILRHFGQTDDAEAYESLLPTSYITELQQKAGSGNGYTDGYILSPSDSLPRYSSIMAPPIRTSSVAQGRGDDNASNILLQVTAVLAQHHLRLSPDGSTIEGHPWDKNMAFIHCARTNNVHLMSMLASTELTIDVQMSALHYAAIEGNVDTIGRLLHLGENVNSKNNYGNTPLILASFRGSVAAVSYLLSRGADPDVKMGDGSTALAVALWSSSDDVAVTLLEAGASYTGLYGGKALHMAARFGAWKALDWLITKGRKVNLTKSTKKLGIEEEEDGFRPLHLAAMNGHLNAVRVLLAAGANRIMQSKSGETPRSLAVAGGFDEIVELLDGWGSKSQYSLR